jgi:hypothetical protein
MILVTTPSSLSQDIFGQWQAEYADRGLATFPVQIVGKDKIPMTRGYHRTGLRGSTELTRRFGSAKALGITLNRYRMIVDVDTTNESVLADVLAERGDTPLVARTASKGGYHVYYGKNEGAWTHYRNARRAIRPQPRNPLITSARASPSSRHRSPQAAAMSSSAATSMTLTDFRRFGASFRRRYGKTSKRVSSRRPPRLAPERAIASCGALACGEPMFAPISTSCWHLRGL